MSVGRIASFVARLALFCAFSWFVYHYNYLPQATAVWAEELSNTVAANHGYPFQLYMGDVQGGFPTQIDPTRFIKYSDMFGEYGLHILVTFTSIIGRMLVGSDFVLSGTIGNAVVAWLLVVTAGVFVLPPVPLLAAIGGVGAMTATLLAGPMGLAPTQHWGVCYVAIVTGVMVASATGAKRNPWALLFLLTAGTLVGFGQYLRQESVGIPYLAAAALVASSWTVAGVNWLVVRDRVVWKKSTSLRVAIRATITAAVLVGFTAGFPFVMRAVYATAWQTPYGETRVATHGSGWPLYLGLGSDANPYNIGWNDVIGQIHVQLIRPQGSAGGEQFQNALQGEWQRLIWERPWVFLRQVSSNASKIVGYMRRETPSSALQPVGQSVWHARFFQLAPFALLLALGAVVWFPAAEAWVVAVGLLGVAAGASAGALVVNPGYLGGPQGAIVVLVFILPAAVAAACLSSRCSPPESARSGSRVVRLSIVSTGLAAAAACLLIAAVVGIRYQLNQRAVAAAMERDPFDDLQRDGFRFGHMFNELASDQQELVIRRLTERRDARVFATPVKSAGAQTIFKPIAALMSPGQAHVIVRLGSTFRPPAPPVFQGATHGIVRLTIGEDAGRKTLYLYDHGTNVWTMINDAEWTGVYRFLSFPAVVAPFTAAAALSVEGYRIGGLDPSDLYTGWSATLLASGLFKSASQMAQP